MIKRGEMGAVIFVSVFLLSAIAYADGPFSQINKDKDAKHTPVIIAPDSVKGGEAFQVTVKVGEKKHPNGTGHFMRSIALYAGEVEVARAYLTPTMTQAEVTFTVILKESTTLRALTAPNHSAAWEATKKITVK